MGYVASYVSPVLFRLHKSHFWRTGEKLKIFCLGDFFMKKSWWKFFRKNWWFCKKIAFFKIFVLCKTDRIIAPLWLASSLRCLLSVFKTKVKVKIFFVTLKFFWKSETQKFFCLQNHEFSKNLFFAKVVNKKKLLRHSIDAGRH